NLNAVEEALGIKELMDVYGLTQEDVSKKIGKSRSAVANSVRLLNLPDSIKAFIKDGVLSMGHARSILALENEKLMNMVATKIIQEDFSVRQTENYIKSLLVEKKTKTVSKEEEELIRYIKSLEESLSSDLGTKIRIVNKKNKGRIEIPYSSAEDFERIIQLIKK
ncbi:MAG: ParB/RepB/Spo0J family partition protein, partial [Eubacteriales bacterium]